jgi:predicted phosphoadenosine phosphosulfate sulfurtransferase
MIEQKGLEEWLKDEEVLSDEYPHADKESYNKRIEYLINWAKENGYEKPKWGKREG